MARLGKIKSAYYFKLCTLHDRWVNDVWYVLKINEIDRTLYYIIVCL